MSILSDRQIRQLCTSPSFMVTTAIPISSEIPGSLALTYKRVDSFSWKTEKELQEEFLRNSIGPLGVKSFHPVTPEELAKWNPMISPYVAGQVRKVEFERINKFATETGEYKVISFGESSFGYDVRLAEDFKIFTNINGSVIDPKNFDDSCLVSGILHEDETGKYVILPPNSYLLGHTIECFNVPRDIMIIALGKSTYARCGAIVNVTPIEPGFIGTIVIEISNSTSLPMKIYANEGISQFVFFQGNESCETSYGDRGGKYQKQIGVQTPIV